MQPAFVALPLDWGYHLIIACLGPLPPCLPHSDGADLELGTRTNTSTLKLLC